MADHPFLQCRRRAVPRWGALAKNDGLQLFRRPSRLLLLPQRLGGDSFRILDRIGFEGDLTSLAGTLRRSHPPGTVDDEH